MEETGFGVPNRVFNIILAMNHNFWHLMYEGIGMRQIVDVYFLLRNSNKEEREETMKLLKKFGLVRFTRATMYVLQSVLGLDEKFLLCTPLPEEGAFLQSKIMRAGNFGQHDERIIHKKGESRFETMALWCKHSMRLFKYYPMDVLWTPLGILYISLWKHLNFRLKRLYAKSADKAV